MTLVNPNSGTLDSAECTCFRLRGLTRRVTQLYDQMLAPSGLSVTQYSVIAHVRRRETSPPTVTELARDLFTDRTTLTRNLQPLLKEGLIEVAAGTDDRSKAILLTRRGEAAYRAARPLWKQAQRLLRERLGETRLAALHELIGAVLVQFEETGGEA